MFREKDYKKSNTYMFMNQEDLLKEFHSEKWNAKNEDEKMLLLQAEALLYAKQIGMDSVPSFRLETNNSLIGTYPAFGGEKLLVYLINCINPYEALSAIVYELNEAYRYQHIKNSPDYLINGTALLKIQNESNNQNQGNDSDAALERFFISYKKYFLDDPTYLAYCNPISEEKDLISDEYTERQDAANPVDNTEWVEQTEQTEQIEQVETIEQESQLPETDNEISDRENECAYKFFDGESVEEPEFPEVESESETETEAEAETEVETESEKVIGEKTEEIEVIDDIFSPEPELQNAEPEINKAVTTAETEQSDDNKANSNKEFYFGIDGW